MNSTLSKQIITALKAFAFILILGGTTLSCQENTEQKEEVATTEEPTTESTLVADKRPAPTFYVIPEELNKQRVWICENQTSDIFHIKHDCPVLVQCKGKGNFRNIPITRAIEFYGRYNCQVCSKELDHIFDEDAVRTLN